MTRHLRAQYVEATLQRTEMSNDEVSVHKDLRTSQIQSSDLDVKRVLASISSFSFTNPFCLDVNPNELYFLSSGVPAKLNVANDRLKAHEIGKNAMEHFIQARLVHKTMGFHEPLKRSKLKTFAASQVTKRVTGSQNLDKPDKS